MLVKLQAETGEIRIEATKHSVDFARIVNRH